MTVTTGLPPVAALADKQSTGLFGASHKLLRNFLPISSPTFLTNQKRTYRKGISSLIGADDGKLNYESRKRHSYEIYLDGRERDRHLLRKAV